MSNTQDDFKIRSIDVQHINPSIMEGESLITSLLGIDTAVTIIRYAPSLISAPIVSGPAEIPGTLSCFEGVYDSSPAPSFSYQWLSDGVLIPGATDKTLLTFTELDSTTITCEVTAANTIGSLVTESGNGIDVSIIEPIDVWEQDFYSISGLNQETRETVYVYRNMVVTGMWVDTRFDMMGFDLFSITGLTVDTRLDLLGLPSMAITGLNQSDTQTVFEQESYVVTVPTFIENPVITNPGAETGDTTGWTVTSGSLTVETTGGASGINFFAGTTDNTDIVAYQDVLLGASHDTDVDDGNVCISVSAFVNASSQYDYVNLSWAYLDASNQQLGDTQYISSDDYRPTQGTWVKLESPTYDAPVGTRSVRLTMSMSNQILTGIATQVDDWEINLFKY